MPVEKLPSGLWRAVVHLAGERRRGQARATRREALSDAAVLLGKLEDELGPTVRRRSPRNSATVGDLLDRHLALSSFAVTTADEMERARRRIPADFAARLVADTTTADVEALYARLRASGIAVGGVRRVHELLGPAFRRAVRWGWIRGNPVREAEAPRATPSRAHAPSARLDKWRQTAQSHPRDKTARQSGRCQLEARARIPAHPPDECPCRYRENTGRRP